MSWKCVFGETRKLRGQKRNVPRAALASGLVCEFPGHDGRLVDVTADERLDVCFECGVHLCVGVEQVVVGRAQDLLDVDIHASVVRPVVRPTKSQKMETKSTSRATHNATMRRMPLAFAAATTLSAGQSDLHISNCI